MISDKKQQLIAETKITITPPTKNLQLPYPNAKLTVQDQTVPCKSENEQSKRVCSKTKKIRRYKTYLYLNKNGNTQYLSKDIIAVMAWAKTEKKKNLNEVCDTELLVFS